MQGATGKAYDGTDRLGNRQTGELDTKRIIGKILNASEKRRIIHDIGILAGRVKTNNGLIHKLHLNCITSIQDSLFCKNTSNQPGTSSTSSMTVPI